MTDRTREADGSAEVIGSAGVEYHPPRKASDGRQASTTTNDSRSTSSSQRANPRKATATRLLGCRVDALVVAFRVELCKQVAELLDSRAQLAAEVAVAELTLGDFAFELKATQREGFLSFQNADVRGAYSTRATGGWRLELVVRATYLATHKLEAALDLVQRMAASFGTLTERPRLRRFDCAADFVGFPLSARDAERFVTKRASIDAFHSEEKDLDEVGTPLNKPAMRVHRDFTRTVTGFNVSAGNPISARIYDKTAELLVPGREEKREIEYARWRASGWDDSARVTRVEFQHRGTFLDEIGLRDASTLPLKLDEVWQHDANWLRMVDPKSATRLPRCNPDPRWVAVEKVTFTHHAAPIARGRLRGGATVAHVFGAVLSRASATGQLTRFPPCLVPRRRNN